MSSEWSATTLGGFVRLQRGHDLTASEQQPGPYPVMGSAGPNGCHNVAKAKGPGVVVGRSGASMGRVHYSESDYWPHNTCLYVTDFLGNSPRFAYYVLSTLDLAGFNSGSAQPSLNRNYIYGMPLRIPHRVEQDAIVEVLSALDDRIALLRETNATLEAIAQALFKSWFVDFDPVHARARGEQPEGLPEPLAALFPESFEESPLGLVPRGWRVGVLGDIVTIKGGKQLDKGSFDDHGANPVFGGAGVMGRTDLKNATGFVITVGRVGAYCGQFFWHIGDAWVNNNSSHIQPASAEKSVWIYQWLRAANIDHIKKGAAQPFVSNGDLAELKMVIPDDGVVNHFVVVASPIYDRMHSLQAQAQTLATLRDTLLPRLISGALRLPDVEAAIEGAAA